jgi:hypothetical protein
LKISTPKIIKINKCLKIIETKAYLKTDKDNMVTMSLLQRETQKAT